MKHKRWKITGTFTLLSPLHVGSGAVRTDRLPEKNGVRCEVQSVVVGVVDKAQRPCLPGSALKGVLRSWAEAFYPGSNAVIERIFGTPDASAANAHAGWADFLNLFAEIPASDQAGRFSKYVPYWDNSRVTGVYSNVCLNREHGVAQENKLFFQEFVPEGVRFPVQIEATRLSDSEITLLLAVLKHGANHPTHPYQFGANSADGWGRVEWKLGLVKYCVSKPTTVSGVGFDCCRQTWTVPVLPLPSNPSREYVAVDVALSFNGPFLVNDTSKAKPAHDETSPLTNFTALACPDGSAWLPPSSFRGAFRQHTERLLRTLDPNATGDPNAPTADGPIQRLFGDTGRASRLRLSAFKEVKEQGFKRAARRHQDFVAIDRFTGGAAEGAKFDATYLERPRFKGKIVLDLAELKPQDIALLGLAVRDLCEGRIAFGFGTSKGYGQATAELKLVSQHFKPENWGLPLGHTGEYDDALREWLKTNIACLFHPQKLEAVEAVPTTNTTPVTTVAPSAVPTAPVGTLIIGKTNNNNLPQLRFTNSRGEIKTLQTVPLDQLAPALKQQLKQLSEGEHQVEYDLKQGKQVNIRLKAPMAGPGAVVANPDAAHASETHFANPYYFLPMKDRDNKFTGDLGDQPGPGHGRYLPGRLSGTLYVKLTTETPLLIPNTRDAENGEDHLICDILMDGDRPLLASSSVRGMLRAAYEAVTNSRFGVFPGTEVQPTKPATAHGRRLGLRLPAKTALDAVPVRIENTPTGLRARLMTGAMSHMSKQGGLVKGPQFAAWVATYGDWTPRGRNFLGHGQRGWAYLTPWEHRKFKFWNVEEICVSSTKPTHIPTQKRKPWNNAGPSGWGKADWYEGYLCDNGCNIDKKHDERFFFDGVGSVPVHVELGSAVEQWRELIADYQDQHMRELKTGETRPPALPSHCQFSRHISTVPPAINQQERELVDGTLCYAVLSQVNSIQQVSELYPVMISRKLHTKSPLQALPQSLHPATRINQLSPADRVFGWVSQQADMERYGPAYRSHVIVGPVKCETDEAVEQVGDEMEGLPLAILGQPKPHQGRFYSGNDEGRAQQSGANAPSKDATYCHRLRGPKVYPHHRDLADNHWTTQPQNHETASTNRYREHLRYNEVRDVQNRSIRRWVRSKVTFSFELQVSNLSRVELGALVWLLSLPEKHYLRLGLGKPLGFGSVRVTLDDQRPQSIADGNAWASAFAQWSKPDQWEALAPLVSEFEQMITKVNPELLKAFKRVAEGFTGLAVHYPRKTTNPTGSEAIYQWFGANDEISGRRQALPDVTDSQPGLLR